MVAATRQREGTPIMYYAGSSPAPAINYGSNFFSYQQPYVSIWESRYAVVPNSNILSRCAAGKGIKNAKHPTDLQNRLGACFHGLLPCGRDQHRMLGTGGMYLPIWLYSDKDFLVTRKPHNTASRGHAHTGLGEAAQVVLGRRGVQRRSKALHGFSIEVMLITYLV